MLRTLAVFASLACAFAFAAPAHAGKGGPDKSSSSIRLVVLDDAGARTSATTAAHYGGSVTFDISTTESHPYVNLRCFQGGVLVGNGWEGFFDGALGDRAFSLYSESWTGGAADCTAWLMRHNSNGRWTALASTSFHVEG